MKLTRHNLMPEGRKQTRLRMGLYQAIDIGCIDMSNINVVEVNDSDVSPLEV